MLESGHLNVLQAISKNQSFSKAADELGITQSAVSQSVKNLENKLGFDLISRQGKSVGLTKTAKKMVTLSEQYYKKFDEVVQSVRSEKEQFLGELSIGTLMGLGKSWIGPKVLEFSKLHPELKINFKMDFPENLQRLYSTGEIDVLIVPENDVPSYADKYELGTEYSTFVYPKTMNLKGDIELKDITALPLIFFEEHDPLFYNWCRQNFGSVPRSVTPRLVINNFSQILAAISEGLGVAVIPTHVIDRSYYGTKVETFSKKSENTISTLYYVASSDNFDLLKVKTFFEFLKK